MWHLIFPPIVIVVSAGILAWYLSRKVAEPEVSAKMKAMLGGMQSGAKVRALSRKEFILKFFERLISFFKVSSLRIHNFFQHSTESIRKQRKKIQEMKRIAGNVSSSAKDRAASFSKPSFSVWWKSKQGVLGKKKRETLIEKAAPMKRSFVSRETTEESAPLRRPVFGFFRRTAIEIPKEQPKDVGHPSTSEGSVVPEVSHRVREEKWREDGYIQRISENPKDVRAYEELGDYYLSIENVQDAKACYKQVLKLDPANSAVKEKIRRLGKFFEKKNT